MKRIITIMVLGMMVASSAMADGPKYGFASRPSGNATVGNMDVRVGVTPSTTISTYRSGSRVTGKSFTPSSNPGNVSTGATVRTSRTVITRRKTSSRPGALSTDYSRNPSASIVTSSTSHSESSGSYGGRSSALGLSSAASTNSGGYSGGSSYSGGGISGVYGRTSSSTSYATSSGSSSSSSSSGPRSILGAQSGVSNDNGEDGVSSTFAAALGSSNSSTDYIDNTGNGSTVDGPIGDAILPLMLLMSLLCVYKWRVRR